MAMPNSVYTDPINHVTKRGVPGIRATNNVASLVTTLARLGLCGSEMAEPMGKIAANSDKPLSEFMQISVHDLDRVLATTDASINDRCGFKASLRQCGLLTVPR